ncbi:hypothetical protein Clacol_001032 [Clathrus columnatus]|uniref:Carboxylic ester hydrolase n=1 Tax=Clathrus columnatus TaxID=1419009 RepID=A0AAV5A1E2_9AGAM|nr:hypothetical protein Clacol_001032 [Clathrus columnatus]
MEDAVQPTNDGQAGDADPRDKVGYGKPTENPFLQFGSPHSLSSPSHAVAAETEEIYVNPAYRLSAFGFLASDQPDISGNFGFKDQWTALEWVRDNIAVFGGNPDDIRISGLSAGAHSVHQLLHHVARLPAGVGSPFHRACLQSNAIVTNPKTPHELRAQYEALLQSLNIDPHDKESLSNLKDFKQTPWERITYEIENNLIQYGTFRGTSDGSFLPASNANGNGNNDGEMEFQASPEFANKLKEKGVRSIIIGDLTEEWYLYSIAHPIESVKDIEPNLKRYYPDYAVERLLKAFDPLPPNASPEECAKLYGRILSDGQGRFILCCGYFFNITTNIKQVHLPVRLLHRDLKKHGFPVLRYEIQWTPPQVRQEGYVTHGTDRSLWAFLTDVLTPDQVPVARLWLKTINAEIENIEIKGLNHDIDVILTLKKDCTIGWTKDTRWEEMAKLDRILNGQT